VAPPARAGAGRRSGHPVRACGRAAGPRLWGGHATLYLSSTFAFKDICTNAGYDYTRSGNPTRTALEEALALLEGGHGATCTSTGMSAILVALNLLPHGSHLIATVDCYGGTFRLWSMPGGSMDWRSPTWTWRTSRPCRRPPVPHAHDLDRDALQSLLRLTDIAAVAELGHRQPDCLVAVDNTFLSPYFQRPFALGADLVIHSTTNT